MKLTWFEGDPPLTKFAPKFKIPIGIGRDGSPDFVNRLTSYLLNVEETIIKDEELVSSVPKSEIDPYKHTQQWKQHNLINDVAGEGGDHLQRFPKDPVIEEFFNILRNSYLEHLANLRYPRIKVYAHSWANILRNGEWISKHSHMTNSDAYLASTYYLTTNKTVLNLENQFDRVQIPTIAQTMVFFPSWMLHWSDKVEDDTLRISIATDIVTENSIKGNPWRPHRLLDDPETMPGLYGR
jgi:hypothetical protein